jgi:hypothetical protein
MVTDEQLRLIHRLEDEAADQFLNLIKPSKPGSAKVAPKRVMTEEERRRREKEIEAQRIKEEKEALRIKLLEKLEKKTKPAAGKKRKEGAGEVEGEGEKMKATIVGDLISIPLMRPKEQVA